MSATRVLLRSTATARASATATSVPRALPFIARVPGVSARARAFSSTPLSLEELQRTPLYDFHKQHQGKLVPFAGWEMPLSYGDVGQGLFDVSHMLQHFFTGPSAQAFLMSLTPSSLDKLPPFTGSLSVILNETGGIIDDTIITKHSDERFYVVTNAGRAKEDVAHIQAKLDEWNSTQDQGKGKEVEWEKLEGWGLVALQGPKSAEVLKTLVGDSVDLAGLKFGQSAYAKIHGVEVHVARGGYTGEDGFEISIPPKETVNITERITSHPDVQLIGLGARDSLRLEAGMCLYGHDLDESVSPVEAGLSWVIGKDRRTPEAAPFPGKSRILDELANGPSRRRVGFEVTGSPAREGYKIFDASGEEEIGVITSGIPSPTLGTNIAMGYIASGHHKKGTAVKIEVRKKLRDAVVKPMPFVPSKYYK